MPLPFILPAAIGTIAGGAAGMSFPKILGALGTSVLSGVLGGAKEGIGARIAGSIAGSGNAYYAGAGSAGYAQLADAAYRSAAASQNARYEAVNAQNMAFQSRERDKDRALQLSLSDQNFRHQLALQSQSAALEDWLMRQRPTYTPVPASSLAEQTRNNIAYLRGRSGPPPAPPSMTGNYLGGALSFLDRLLR